MLQREDGRWVDKPVDVINVMVNFMSEVYCPNTTHPIHTQIMNSLNELDLPHLTLEDLDTLNQIPYVEEIHQQIFEMKPILLLAQMGLQ